MSEGHGRLYGWRTNEPCAISLLGVARQSPSLAFDCPPDGANGCQPLNGQAPLFLIARRKLKTEMNSSPINLHMAESPAQAGPSGIAPEAPRHAVARMSQSLDQHLANAHQHGALPPDNWLRCCDE